MSVEPKAEPKPDPEPITLAKSPLPPELKKEVAKGLDYLSFSEFQDLIIRTYEKGVEYGKTLVKKTGFWD